MSARKGGLPRVRPHRPRSARARVMLVTATVLGFLLVAAVVVADVVLLLLADVGRAGVLVAVTAVLGVVAIAHGGGLYVAEGAHGARLVLRLPLAR